MRKFAFDKIVVHKLTSLFVYQGSCWK